LKVLIVSFISKISLKEYSNILLQAPVFFKKSFLSIRIGLKCNFEYIIV